MKYLLTIISFLTCFCINAQTANIISVEQKGQQIYITYDLQGSQGKYEIKLFVKSNNNNSWSSALKSVSGNVGANQTVGSNKQIVWDVLNDREKFEGDWVFGIEAINVTKQKRLEESKKNKSNDEIVSVSYSLGVNIGENIKSQFSEINLINFFAAINDVLDISKEPLISDTDAQKKIQEYFSEDKIKANESVLEKGKKFLAENSKKKNIITLESGLQYEVIKHGEGVKPRLNDQVIAHYYGTLIDGTIFDSSIERGQPASFRVNAVIKGWTEALQLMTVGSKWKLFVPYDLAYGERGAGSQIGPFTTLIFEIELISVL